MPVIITSEQFKAAFPKAKIDFSAVLNKVLVENDINTVQRAAGFISQCAHESGEFTVFSENLNYSTEGLLKVFPKYFTKELAATCSRKPDMIANITYANRIGNGPKESGDGYKFRGRGAIQLTGKSNYIAFMKFCGFDSLDKTIEYILTPEGIIKSAVWFWVSNKLNAYADKSDLKGMTKRINGGYLGLDHRLELYKRVTDSIKKNFTA